jgi:hypothetical protein
MWHIDPLLGNGSKTVKTMVLARQQLCKYATVLEPLLSRDPRNNGSSVGNDVLHVVRSEDLSINRPM